MRTKIMAGPVLAFRRGEPRAYFKMEKKGDAAEIYIYDIIGGDWFGEGTTAKSFQKDLKALGDVSTLNIYINSPGGDVADGTAIFNILDRHRARKVVQIDGLAASIASVIAMVGDEVVMPNNALLMIHDPWAVTIGTAEEHRKSASALDTVRDAILTTYARRTGMADEKIAKMMAEETWMTAAEAVDMGFADRTTESVEMAALTKFDLSQFRRAPEALAKPIVAAAPVAQNTERHPKLVIASARLQKYLRDADRGQAK